MSDPFDDMRSIALGTTKTGQGFQRAYGILFKVLQKVGTNPDARAFIDLASKLVDKSFAVYLKTGGEDRERLILEKLELLQKLMEKKLSKKQIAEIKEEFEEEVKQLPSTSGA